MERSFERTIALMQTLYFWGVVAILLTVSGFLLAGMAILTDFDIMRMKYCFNASNIHAFLMFFFLMFFVFCGFMAIGEVFNFFDNHRRGIPHKSGLLFWLVVCSMAFGATGLMMVKHYC